jgi:hypothetical protein
MNNDETMNKLYCLMQNIQKFVFSSSNSGTLIKFEEEKRESVPWVADSLRKEVFADAESRPGFI